MRFSKVFVLAVVVGTCTGASAQTGKYDGVGRPPTAEEVRAWDMTVFPSGKGLPPGKGTAKEGAPIYRARCTMCHSVTGKEVGPLGPIVVGSTTWQRGAATSWPFATSVWDYINRAMPRYQEGTLTPDQVYAVTAFLLYSGGIIKEDEVMDATSLPAIQMPNRNGWVPSRVEDIADVNKRGGRNGQYPGPDPTATR